METEFFKRLRKWRERSDLTQKQAAVRCFVSEDHYRKWELGVGPSGIVRRLLVAFVIGREPGANKENCK